MGWGFRIGFIALVLFLFFASFSPVAASDVYKWRIGYYEGGPFEDYQATLIATLRGLKRQGWIDYETIPELPPERTDTLWHWMATEVESDSIRFLPDAHYSAEWNEDYRSGIVTLVQNNPDITFMIGMGTWAGKDLADAALNVPLVVHSSSNPVDAGIVSDSHFSGREDVHATVHPYLYHQQTEVFHGIVKFNRLGVFFQDDEVGRSYAHIDAIETVAATRGFEIATCPTMTDLPPARQEEVDESVVTCFKDLAPRVDAILITTQQGVNENTIPKLVELSIEHGVPTFDQEGKWTKNGIMMSLSQENFDAVGDFNARVMTRIMTGEMPESISQVFRQPAEIAVNIETALRIGFSVPPALVGTADQIFYAIEP